LFSTIRGGLAHFNPHTLREEHILSVFKNRVLMKIFGPMREEVRGGYRNLLSDELLNLYSSSNIRVMKLKSVTWEGQRARSKET
jgi:hypothetical protein